MEQIAIDGLNTLTFLINALSALIDRHPWVGQAIVLSPVLPALIQRSILGVLLAAAMAFAGLVTGLTHSGFLGAVIWGAAWYLSIAFAKAKRQRRALKNLQARA